MLQTPSRSPSSQTMHLSPCPRYVFTVEQAQHAANSDDSDVLAAVSRLREPGFTQNDARLSSQRQGTRNRECMLHLEIHHVRSGSDASPRRTPAAAAKRSDQRLH